jgi:hypothetical protein
MLTDGATPLQRYCSSLTIRSPSERADANVGTTLGQNRLYRHIAPKHSFHGRAGRGGMATIAPFEFDPIAE